MYRNDLTTVDKNAVCNDGSPAYIYTSSNFNKEHANPVSNNWFLFLEGGWWCWDKVSCTMRQHAMDMWTTSKHSPSLHNVTGIMAPKDSVFPPGTQFAYVHYCSSDAYLGDFDMFNSISDETVLMKFRGRVIVKAALKFLESKGLGSKDSDKQKLYVSGCSAGATGVGYWFQKVREMYSNVEVLPLMDSPMDIDVKNQAGLPTIGEQFKALYELDSEGIDKNIINEACAAKYKDEKYKCIMPEYQSKFWKPPYFVSEHQYDFFQVQYMFGYYNMSGEVPRMVRSNGNDTQVLQEFRRSMRSAMDSLSSTVYSSACFRHCTWQGERFFQKTADLPSVHTVMTQFLRNPNGVHEYRSDCQGIFFWLLKYILFFCLNFYFF